MAKATSKLTKFKKKISFVIYVEKKKPTRCHLMLYCSYELLYMFRALICPSSSGA
jgi:hypothetical protein